MGGLRAGRRQGAGRARAGRRQGAGKARAGRRQGAGRARAGRRALQTYLATEGRPMSRVARPHAAAMGEDSMCAEQLIFR